MNTATSNDPLLGLFSFTSEEALTTELRRLADGTENHALAMLLRVLADSPPDVAAAQCSDLRALASKLHPDTDGPATARLAAHALESWLR